MPDKEQETVKLKTVLHMNFLLSCQIKGFCLLTYCSSFLLREQVKHDIIDRDEN